MSGMSQTEAEQAQAERAAFEAQRARERTGINGAAEAGVFDSSEPPELARVREAQAWQEAQFERENRPLDFTKVPVFSTDSAPRAGDTVPASWDEDALAPIDEQHLTPPLDGETLAADNSAGLAADERLVATSAVPVALPANGGENAPEPAVFDAGENEVEG